MAKKARQCNIEQMCNKRLAFGKEQPDKKSSVDQNIPFVFPGPFMFQNDICTMCVCECVLTFCEHRSHSRNQMDLYSTIHVVTTSHFSAAGVHVYPTFLNIIHAYDQMNECMMWPTIRSTFCMNRACVNSFGALKSLFKLFA